MGKTNYRVVYVITELVDHESEIIEVIAEFKDSEILVQDICLKLETEVVLSDGLSKGNIVDDCPIGDKISHRLSMKFHTISEDKYQILRPGNIITAFIETKQ